MKVFQAERHFQTSGGLHVTDITAEVAEIVLRGPDAQELAPF